jgi:magnesium transporter
MSDHETHSFDDTRYSTPVPELDDHRHQSASVQRNDRSRRGTVDTLYGAAARKALGPDLSHVNEILLHTDSQDNEEAVMDDEAPAMVRRGTTTTISPRSMSPPNSVKAFAAARRQERGLSTSDECGIYRTGSGTSHRSQRSQRSHRSHRSNHSHRTRRYTLDNDAASLASSIRSVEDDVCFPQPQVAFRDKNKLHIDFDYLERFIAEEERDPSPPKNQPQRIFQDLRLQNQSDGLKTFNADGEMIEVPSGESSLQNEKYGVGDKFDDRPQQYEDNNRFSFFSSAWESTIHAAEFGDLIMPGEDIRGLFYLPENTEEDGVWWLNMNNPTEEEIRSICKAFGIHPLTIEDIGTQETREKIELFPSYYFACFRSFSIVETEDGPELEPFNIYVIVFREGTLSFSFSPNPHAACVRKRITMLKDYVALSSDWICYALM